MKTDNCLFCGKELTHVAGRKRKMYCDGNCRQKHYQASNKLLAPLNSSIKATPITTKEAVAVYNSEHSEQKIEIIEGPMKEVLQEASKENAKLGIQAAITAIRAEKIPKERDTPNGRKSWAFDQKKRIQELEKQLQ